MKTIRQVLQEKKGEKAHRQAVEMGLKYKGFGYWVDPSTGQVTHKTENDELVPVEPDVESEKAGKDDTAGMAGPDAAAGGPQIGAGGSFGGFMGQLPTGDGSGVLGTTVPGEAQGDRNANWDPGPDGDNFIKTADLAQDNKLPVDTFVGKTNYYNWTAGPDGDNYQTLSFNEIIAKAQGISEAEDPGAMTMFRKMLGYQNQSADDPSHVQRARQVYQDQSDTGKGEMMRDVMQGGMDKGNMNIRMDRLPAKMERRDNRKDQVKRLNQSIQGLVQDPNYDMSQKGDLMGEGMFGAVYDSKDGKHVIKEGKLSAKELAILHKLNDVKAFPNLVNAEVSTPFQSADDIYEFGSDSENEAMNDDSKGEGMRYFNDMPFADGKMVMSKINGYPFSDMKTLMTVDEQEKFMQKLWAARGAMHKLGISHNDMHHQNFFVDDAGNPGILDLGLANDDPLSALMEAIGGVTGSDYQLDTRAKLGSSSDLDNISFVPNALRAKIEQNMGSLRENLMDRMQDYMDPDAEDSYDDVSSRVEEVMRGGLRLGQNRLNDLRQRLPFLEDNDTVLDLIRNFYDNVQDTETGQRMSNAFDKLQDDRVKVAQANLLRQRRGEEPIKDKLKDVLDPDN